MSARHAEVVRELIGSSDYGHDDRPRIGEKTLGKAVQDVLRKGGGTPGERANVAVGLIAEKVARAYKVDAA